MTYRMGQVVEDSPDTVVRVPEAEPRRLRVATVPAEGPWLRSSDTTWIAAAVAAVIVAALLVWVFHPTGSGVVQANGAPPAVAGTAPAATEPAWTAQTIPVPESLRTHTVNVDGSQDLLALAAAGAGRTLVGASVTADGPVVQAVYDERAFTVSSPTAGGATIVVFVPHPSGDQPVLEVGDEVTFQGTVLPVPPDFDEVVGGAASVGRTTGIYVVAVPVTIQLATDAPA
jgi:hypothetical protein